MAPYLGSYTGEDSDDEDGRNSPTSSPCELTYNNLFERVNCLSNLKAEQLTETRNVQESTGACNVIRQCSPGPEGNPIYPVDGLEGNKVGHTDLTDPYTISIDSGATGRNEGHTGHQCPGSETDTDPQQIRPQYLGNIIEEPEQKIKSKTCGWEKSLPNKRAPEDDVLKSLSHPVASLLVPFSHPANKLQHRIECLELPQKLIIHDPWQLLTFNHSQDDTDINIPRTEILGNTAIYQLQHVVQDKTCFDTAQRASQEYENGVDEPSDHRELHGFFLDFPKASSNPIAPAVYVIYPAPPTSFPVPEAHIHLPSAHLARQDTHSRVYHAELELPRHALISFDMCEECIREDIMAKLKEEDGENGEHMDEKWKSKTTSVEIVQVPKHGTGVTAKSNTEFTCLNQVDSCGDTENPQLGPVKLFVQVTGPIRRIRTSIPWRDISHPTTCNHPQSMASNAQTGMKPYLPITKIRVVAKLSTGNSEQLLDEARKYQEFASHLPDHSIGINPIPPSQDAVPGGAIVPQFYGYYIPRSGINQKSDHEVGRSHTFQGAVLLMKDRESIGDFDVDDKLAPPSLPRQSASSHQ